MDHTDFSWERRNPPRPAVELSAEDIETIARLMLELRDITLSRASYQAATDFLKRFGFDIDSGALVRPEQLAH